MKKIAELKENFKFNPLQERVVNNESNNMIIAHPVGSGKTLSGIAKFEELKKKGLANKALIITPAGLRTNYSENGIKKFTDSSYNIIGNKGEITKGTGKNPDSSSDYNIISYEMFRKDPVRYMEETGADTIITDEVHKLKNPNTSTLNSFYESKPYYKNFIGLTGSVISNKISDIYNLVDLASGGNHKLGEDVKEFEETYLKRDNSRKYQHIAKEKRPVVGFNNKRRLKKELDKYVDYAGMEDIRELANIPKKDINIKNVYINKIQANAYKKLIRQNPNLYKLITQKRLETLKDDELAKAFSEMIEARKLMNSPHAVLPNLTKEDGYNSPKVKKILDDMTEHLNSTEDGQAILLSNLINGGIETLEDGLNARGIEYGKFIGKGNKGITEESRQKAINDYNDRKKRVMLISGAGAEGLSLNDTTWEGVLDGHYNPERMNQMEARGIRSNGLMHRDPKDRRVEVNRYVAKMPKTLGVIPSPYKTPDEMIYEIAGIKERQNKLLFDLLKKGKKIK